MTYCQSLQAELEILGIEINQRRVNIKVLTTILSYGSQNVLNVTYFFYGANSLRQYTEAIFMTCCTITIGTAYTIFVLKIGELFEFIEKISTFIDESK